jgi:cellulose synthase/poly-beta-1,6-N-acetylglucosamine synthase-like glycosyltransferase
MSERTSRLVSVVVPAYNAQATIGECLAGLCRQSYSAADLEILVVDDGSIDKTAELVQTLQNEDAAEAPLLKLLRQPKNQGPATARNQGAAAAEGSFLLFTDADCIPHGDWVREMVAPFACPSVAAVKGAYKTRQRDLVARFAQAEFDARYERLAKAASVDVVFTYAAAFRREIFSKIGGFDSRFPVANNEDTEFAYRLAAAGYRIVFNSAAIVDHRHPATLREYLSKKFWRAYWRAVVYRRFPGKAIRDSYTPESLKLQVGMVYVGVLGAALVPLAHVGFYVVGAAAVGFVASSLPFLWRLSREDLWLKVAAPFLLLCRAVVMAAGLVFAVPRLMSERLARPEPALDGE